MSKTIAEIGKEVLQEIGRLPDGQVAPASQLKTVKDAYTGLYEELLNDSLVNWPLEDDAIPEFATDSLIILLSGRVAGKFGVPNVWRAAEPLMRKKLGSQISSPYEPQPTTFEDF
jgi:hypothetical protein